MTSANANISPPTSSLHARTEELNRRHRRQQMMSKVMIYFLLLLGTLIFVLPLILMISTSFKSFTEINSYPPTFLPNEWLLSNYPDAWNYQTTDFPRWTMNTLIILFGALPGVLLTSSLCAYGFARLNFIGKNFWFILTLASVMLPPQSDSDTALHIILETRMVGYVLAFNRSRVVRWRCH